MTRFCTDEHVPRVFVTTLRSSGYDVVTATEVFGQGTDDRELLTYCASERRVLITNDKKDFGDTLGGELTHAGIVIYTDTIPFRRSPSQVVRTLEHVFEQYSRDQLIGERIWLDQWYDLVG